MVQWNPLQGKLNWIENLFILGILSIYKLIFMKAEE